MNRNFDTFLKDSPSNTISSLKFASKENILISTSWDNNLYIYKFTEDQNIIGNLAAKQIFTEPQMDCCFEGRSANNVLSVGLDGDLKKINLDLLSCEILSGFSFPLNKVDYEDNRNLIYFCGWDDKLRNIDARINNLNNTNINNIDTNMNISEFTFSGGKLVVTGVDNTNTNLINIYDLRSTSKSLRTYETPLKYPTSALCPINKGDGFLIGSVEGKIALEYFEQSLQNESDKNKIYKNNYAFKCHRQETDTKTIIYPINTISFHPERNIYFSGGSDRFLYVWDNDKRKKMFKSPNLNLPVICSSLNSDGSLLALALSENYENFEFPSIAEKEKHQIMLLNTNVIYN